VNVAKTTPTLSTTASADVPIGGSLKDEAVLAGGNNPGGQITFNLYGPDDAGCAEGPKFTQTVTVAGNGTYETGSVTPSTAGIYRWVASYSGDAENESVSGACNDAGESTTVAKATPTISTVASGDITLGSGSLKDKATIASGFTPGGQITFNLYGPDDTGCSGAPVHTATMAVSDNGTYETPPFTPAKAGTYRWVASYSGDSNNKATSGACNDAGESASVAPAPVSPAPPPPLACPNVSVRVAPYRPTQRLDGRMVPGLRIRLRVHSRAKLTVSTSLLYQVDGKRNTVSLGQDSLRTAGARNLRLPLPEGLRSTLPLGEKVQLRVGVTAAPVPPSPACKGPQKSIHRLSGRVVMVLAG
ncbi:MAG TPA: hypothetical protein VG518_07760, partial [Solirubrobacterales bacterium]|nr:hypothetical protein [Solirubrobacterales bacterium]